MSILPRIAVTAGEPAGIGIDLCVMLARHPFPAALVVIADRDALLAQAAQLGQTIECQAYDAQQRPQHLGDGRLTVLDIDAASPPVAGRLDTANGPYVLHTLQRAIDGCVSGEFDAMATAPVHKGVINDAGVAFTGHTEFLAEQTRTPEVVMMLVGAGMRVALATRHLPLTQVSAAITQAGLERTIRILHHDLVQHFAGEGGYLGTEEITIITPVLEKLRTEGMNLLGPLPADTLFTPHNLEKGDCVLAMYHDQGLPVLKHASFGGGVNVTLGLPIIRTSVDHGTALDIAGKGIADIGSLLAAIALAVELSETSISDR